MGGELMTVGAHRMPRTWGPRLASAVLVEEIQDRLRCEATQARRPPRVVTVVARTVHAAAEGPSQPVRNTAPLDPSSHRDDDHG